uniref:Uncharacterized protein n=1 Tax=Anopheles christyi TaxID=43041 RepID=A0A182KCA0_9DIPT
MTLSRGPYSELDKMSLFQDLKLKRRKVDSRCSSDGESIADTSTSSPDLLQPLSPKMCDQQQQSAHQGLQQKGPSLGNSGDGLQKETPEALTSPPTTPSSADEEQEQLSSSAGGFDTSANDTGSNNAAGHENNAFKISSNYHANRLNGSEIKDGCARPDQNNDDERISVSYQTDGTNPSPADTSMSTSSTKPPMSRYDNGTVLNAVKLKDEAYECSHRASPDCSPDVLIEEHTAARNGGHGSASNVTAASVIRSVADEQRPRSVNPPTSCTTTATTSKGQTSSSSSGGNVINNSSYGRLDSTPSIKIQTGHNTSNSRCAVTTTTTTTTTCHSDSGASSKDTNAIPTDSVESLHQQYDEECTGVAEDVDRTTAQNGMAEGGSAVKPCTGNGRTIAGSGQTQQHVTVLVTPPLSRMKSNHLSTAQGNSTGSAATAAAAAAAAATTLVTITVFIGIFISDINFVLIDNKLHHRGN